MDYFISILLVYGITNIIVRGSIFYGIKHKIEDYSLNCKSKLISWLLTKFHLLINCMMCSGFWVGAFVGYFYGPFEWWNVLFNGCYYSGICWLFQCITQYFGQGEDPERSMDVHINNYIGQDDPEDQD